MLGPDPCWDQIQNSKNAHRHAKIQCWTPFVLLYYLISLHIVLVSLTKNIMRDKTFINELYLSTNSPTLLDGKEGECYETRKINYRFLKPQKQTSCPHWLSGPITISYCGTLCHAVSIVIAGASLLCEANHHQSCNTREGALSA